MSKSKTHIPTNASDEPHTLYDLFLPHKPVRWRNEIVNPVTGEISEPPSRTKQEFTHQCDINNIIKEFSLTGQINHISAAAQRGAFLDLPDSVDYQDHLNTLLRAQESFAALPAAIRNRFHGDPAEFLAFVSDPRNAEELYTLGIRERPRQAPTEPATPPAAPAAPTPTSGSVPASGGS